MQQHWLEREQAYDGTQLRSHFIAQQTGAFGDAICAFAGPADVPLNHMVDLADVAARAPIFSKKMLHFIVEHFHADLDLMIARQRLLTAIAAEELRQQGVAEVRRFGDDIFDGDRKVSVSIATSSPVSALIHFALNIESEGTPVPTRGLADYRIEPRGFAAAVMQRYCDELASMTGARCKVRSVP